MQIHIKCNSYSYIKINKYIHENLIFCGNPIKTFFFPFPPYIHPSCYHMMCLPPKTRWVECFRGNGHNFWKKIVINHKK